MLPRPSTQKVIKSKKCIYFPFYNHKIYSPLYKLQFFQKIQKLSFMSHTFLQNFSCIQSPQSSNFTEKPFSFANIRCLKSQRQNKAVYSLKQKKYIEKNCKLKISLKNATKTSTNTFQLTKKQNQRSNQNKYKKTLKISSQISMKHSPFPNDFQLKKHTIERQTQILKGDPDFFCQDFNIRSTQGTQLPGAQSTVYSGRIKIEKQISNQSTEMMDFSQSLKTSELLHKDQKNRQIPSKPILMSQSHLLQRRNRPYTSVLIHSKLKLIEIDQEEAERSPSLRDLNIKPWKIKRVQEQQLKNGSTQNSTTYAMNDSLIPSIRSKEVHRFQDMDIRSTQSIKEQDESLDEFSQVLNKSRLSFQQKTMSLNKI